MRFQILGPIVVTDEDGQLQLDDPRLEALLAYLLLHANEPVSTAELLEALWGEGQPGIGTTEVQDAVARLSRRLGDRIVTTGSGYLIRVEPGELDLEEFRRLVARARAGSRRERTAILGKALGLWRGKPLAGIEPAAFAGREIAALEDERLAALASRVEVELELGHHAEVLPLLSSLAAEYPLDERFRTLLIIARLRQHGALEITQGRPRPESGPVPEFEKRTSRRGVVLVAVIGTALVIAGAALAVTLTRSEEATQATPSTGSRTSTAAGTPASTGGTVTTGKTVPIVLPTTAAEGDGSTTGTTATSAVTTTATATSDLPGSTATVPVATTTLKTTTSFTPPVAVTTAPTTTGPEVVTDSKVYWLSDDFSVAGIDSGTWHLANKGTGISAGELDGRLQLSVGTEISPDPTSAVDLHYGTRCRVVGDFDATVDFQLLHWPANDGMWLSLGLWTPAPNASWISIERRGAPAAGGAEAYGAPGGGYVQTSDARGSFRLRRKSSFVTIYYRRGARWVSLGTIKAARPSNLILTFAGNGSTFGNQAASVAFDNFEAFADGVRCGDAPVPPRKARAAGP